MIQLGVDLTSEPLVTEFYFGHNTSVTSSNSEIHCALQSSSLWLLITQLFFSIGASLSKPHTRGTALQDACECRFACIRVATYRKYFRIC